jgi:membrane-associated protease RseP (regulator of RpoE activity)
MAESVQAIPTFIEPAALPRSRALRPTAREWLRHSLLFLVTIASTTFAGVTIAADSNQLDVAMPDPSRLIDYLFYIPEYYVRSVAQLLDYALHNPAIIFQGLIFSAALLAILVAHEMGHYVACRRYGVDATLPFFIPAPPLFLAGTFGAFIKIRSQIPSRRALFDIGLAGPLAGFVVAMPVAFLGILTLQPAPPPVLGHGITSLTLNDPLLIRLVAGALRVRLDNAAANPYYMAAWLGLLVTSLNLMPVGQLDGGHGTFAVFGLLAHKWIGRIAFVSMAVLALLGWFWHGSPSGFLYTVLLAIMLKVRHPQPGEMEPLGTARIWIAILTLIVFALSFWPFPITIT